MNKKVKKSKKAKRPVNTTKNIADINNFSLADVTKSFQQKRNSSEMKEIGIDEEFQFSCKQCGKCCKQCEDILLSPYDIYRAARELKMTLMDFFQKYCEMYIGPDSRMVIVRLKPRGSIKRCPLLKDGKCSIHNAKPSSCALFPIGRFLVSPDDTNPETKEISYVLTHTDCGIAHTHTVRVWLEKADIPNDDQFFIEWSTFFIKISEVLRTYEKKNLSRETLHLAWKAITSIYLSYDTSKEFMPQFLKTRNELLSLFTLFKDV